MVLVTHLSVTFHFLKTKNELYIYGYIYIPSFSFCKREQQQDGIKQEVILLSIICMENVLSRTTCRNK